MSALEKSYAWLDDHFGVDKLFSFFIAQADLIERGHDVWAKALEHLFAYFSIVDFDFEFFRIGDHELSVDHVN